MSDSLHLLLPLLSSILFVLAATLAKQATLRGVSPFTATFLSNGLLAACWMVVGLVNGDWLPLAAWWAAVVIACMFVTGQLSTYLAFRLGDVSLATPVFGIKIIMVALIMSMLAQRGVETRVWIAAALATVGVAVIQLGSSTANSPSLTARRAALAIGFAVLAATALTLFDIGVQFAGRQFGSIRFLSTMFVWVGVLSLGLLPWCDSLASIKRMRALKPLTWAGVLMATQAISITFALAHFGDATRVNIVYSLRGLWSVLLAWLLSRLASSPEAQHSNRTLLYRLVGATLLTAAVVIAL